MNEHELEEMELKLRDGWVKGKPYVFVSYASKNKDKVYETVLELRKRGINVYVDIELQENISKNWIENIKDRLFDYDCKGMVSFLSIDFMRSYACLFEQLMTTSDDMKDQKGDKLSNFYISLDERMGTPQGIKSVIYGNDAKESQQLKVTMVPEERTALQEIMDNNAMIKESGKSVSSELDKIKTKHNVVINMYKYFFEKESVSLQLYHSAKACAELLYNNFVKDKNDSIQLEVLPELVERYKDADEKDNSKAGLKQNGEGNPTVNVKEDKTEERPDEVGSEDELLYYAGAVGKDNGLGGIIILKDSKISKSEAASCPEGARNKRKEAIDGNKMVSEGDYFVLKENMVFKSLSGAACFVSGASVNGKLVWKSKQKPGQRTQKKHRTLNDNEISSKINQICMVIQKLKEEDKPIENYSKTLQKIYEKVAEELNIGKSSVVDKCQRQLDLSAMEFTTYAKEYINSENDTLYEIVMKAAQTPAEEDLVEQTFGRDIQM